MFIQTKTLEIAILFWGDENKNFPWFKRDKRTEKEKKVKCCGDEQNKNRPERKSLLSRNNNCSHMCCKNFLTQLIWPFFFEDENVLPEEEKTLTKNEQTSWWTTPKVLWREKKRNSYGSTIQMPNKYLKCLPMVRHQKRPTMFIVTCHKTQG